MQAALELTRDTLTAPETAAFGDDLKAVLTQTSQGRQASGRVRATLARLGKQAQESLKEILTAVAAEAVRRQIFGP